ncbi:MULTISPECIES: cold shock domain-containing protein [Streptomycetaceae]|uniref:cold-shock protein n=1 Tax=Embleya scabrispora TaxID=159449 RepID=UPI00131A1C0D|nr:cold shock domain-containing protein [Streptomyces sp. SID5474]
MTEDGGNTDILVHKSSIESDEYDTLPVGTRVEFRIVQGTRGPQAEKVRVL